MFPDERHYADKTKEDGVGEVMLPHKGEKKCLQCLMGKSKGKRQFGRPVSIWKDNFKMEEDRNGSSRIE